MTEAVSSLLYFGGSDDALGLPFENPKPIYVAQKMIKSICGKDDIILDFFSGSATTAHAVMQLNAEDGGNRKFIMVQLPEATDEKSEANKAGYKNICEIGKERIRRAGEKIKQENPQFIKDYNWFFKEVWLYPQPIKRDTEVMRGVIVKKLRKDRNGEIYYVTLAEDGKLYVDNDECVMGENRETISTYLHELREDLIAGGDIE
jgi:hypothetical protein